MSSCILTSILTALTFRLDSFFKVLETHIIVNVAWQTLAIRYHTIWTWKANINTRSWKCSFWTLAHIIAITVPFTIFPCRTFLARFHSRLISIKPVCTKGRLIGTTWTHKSFWTYNFFIVFVDVVSFISIVVLARRLTFDSLVSCYRANLIKVPARACKACSTDLAFSRSLTISPISSRAGFWPSSSTSAFLSKWTYVLLFIHPFYEITRSCIVILAFTLPAG